MDIRGFTVHELYIEKASDIAEEYYAAIIFDRSAKKPMVMLSRHGRHGRRGGRREGPRRDAHDPRRPADRLLRLPRPRSSPSSRASPRTSSARSARCSAKLYDDVHRRGRDARRGQPAARHRRPRGRRARLEGHGRRQRALPPSGHRGAAQRRRRGPAGADGQGARPDLREARRQRRHPRQRRRARDVDARRGRPGGRQAGELPGRRRRLEGRGDRRRGRGDPLGREGHRRAVQHLRRHHALRRGRATGLVRRSSRST